MGSESLQVAKVPQELVSVIIPTYRRPKVVKAAVLSALAQTWPAVEVVVVADGPDLETRAALAAIDGRVRYLELPENQGPAMARNAGVRASRGQWLAFLDDDDLMLPHRIAAQMQIADAARPEVMVASRAIYRRGSREDVWPERPIAAGEDVAEYLLRRPSLLRRPGVIALQTMLVHRRVLEAVPFTTHKDHEDWAWLLEAWHLAGARVVFAWEPLVVYAIDTEGASRSRRVNWEDSLDWALRYREWMGDRAFCSFLATKVALKAKRAGDRQGFAKIAKTVLRSNPGLLELCFLAGTGLLPGVALHGLWKKSLHSPESSSALPGMLQERAEQV